ncbi:MAG TPA: hypothetical protein EYP04_11785 [Anaerolineae bacterium]|nr:hypothetical protein [Anaerolineae bacterium]
MPFNRWLSTKRLPDIRPAHSSLSVWASRVAIPRRYRFCLVAALRLIMRFRSAAKRGNTASISESPNRLGLASWQSLALTLTVAFFFAGLLFLCGCPNCSRDPVVREYGRWHVGVIYRDGKLVELGFGIPAHVRDKDLRRIAELVELDLEDLDLAWTQVTDASLLLIKRCTRMRELSLDGTHITDAGLRQLSGFTDLVLLNIGDTAITDQGAEYLAEFERLEHLSLIRTKVSDDGISHLENLRHLEVLYLDETVVGDKALESIGRLRNLRRLSVVGTRISDAGLAHLAGLASLEDLRLSQTQITDQGLSNLHGLRKLERLDLRETEVTEGRVRSLRKTMPWIRYLYSGKLSNRQRQ